MSLGYALELAERGRVTTRPNPVVGAVVEQAGEVVGEGWHKRRAARMPRSLHWRPRAAGTPEPSST